MMACGGATDLKLPPQVGELESGDTDDTLHIRFDLLLEKATDLCQKCEELINIPGMTKLHKKCQAEKRFLLRVCEKNQLSTSHLSSTNLGHLQAILDSAESLPHVVQVLQPFACNDTDQPVVVDVVCNHGYVWVKVIARNAQALHLIWAGQGQFGEKSVVGQARLYHSCATEHPVTFTIPEVVFLFTSGVTHPLAAALEEVGITVIGERVDVEESTDRQLYTGVSDISQDSQSQPDDFSEKLLDYDDDDLDIPSASELARKMVGAKIDIDDSSELGLGLMTDTSGDCKNENQKQPEMNANQKQLYSIENLIRSISSLSCKQLIIDSQSLLGCRAPQIGRVNLDITTLICLVSNLCHGGCHWRFAEDVLTQQAEWESRRPALAKIKEFLKDKELFACQTAITDFRSILGTVGGVTEKARAEELLQRVEVVPDVLSARAEALKVTHQVKQRAKTIFGTGDELKAVTVTANSGFVRASMKQGVNFAVFLHESRALSEQKEATALTATPL